MTAHDPRVVETVRRMKGDGIRNADIAKAVGMTESMIVSLCCHRGIKRGSATVTGGRLELALGARLMETYRTEASRRNVEFSHFMRTLLLTIAADDLFTAILDDGK